MQYILISACMLGKPVRYNGLSATVNDNILGKWIDEGRVISMCPEVAAGMPTPRPPAEIVSGGGGVKVLFSNGRVIESSGQEVTAQFVRGAQIALKIALEHGVRMAVLKNGSPSCGSGYIYDGTFSGETTKEQGVTAALLAKNGIKVFSEEDLVAAAQYLRWLETNEPASST